jgi:hypothetical protein
MCWLPVGMSARLHSFDQSSRKMKSETESTTTQTRKPGLAKCIQWLNRLEDISLEHGSVDLDNALDRIGARRDYIRELADIREARAETSTDESDILEQYSTAIEFTARATLEETFVSYRLTQPEKLLVADRPEPPKRKPTLLQMFGLRRKEA